jgi:uncharacterized protein (DUF362 family)
MKEYSYITIAKVPPMSRVFLCAAGDRGEGVRKLFREAGSNLFIDKRVAVKANYNSADPFPASTHTDTLRSVVEELKSSGAGEIVLAERSGMGETRMVLEERGVVTLGRELGFETIILDELPAEGWVYADPPGSHWKSGFWVAKIFAGTGHVVQTCCLKTHRFGGHFTMSLKNSVGLVAKTVPHSAHNYMQELHSSPEQRKMIAEINTAYNVDLVIMDAAYAFRNGGPESGDLIHPGVLLASKDRVATDATGIALLRSYGSTKEVMQGRIFDLEQIARAAELGVGAASADEIELVGLDSEGERMATALERILRREG